MKILIACEFSGVVRDAFISKGYDAVSCDILPSETKGPHYTGDVRDLLNKKWAMIVAHPPCTYLSNSGVCHLYKDESRWDKMLEAAEFFKLFLDHPCKKIVIENPIMHKYAKTAIGGVKQSQVIQPWMFGHKEQKATCLWLKGLPLLQQTNNVKDEMMLLPKNQRQRLHYLPPTKDRQKLRSTTFQGIANAIVSQYGPLLY